MTYRFHTELSEAVRAIELTAMINRGNHKSAGDKPAVVNKLLLKDATHGFSLPLPPSTVALIKGALVQPLGLAKEWTLNESRERIPKYRLTQDLSFSMSQDACSVNDHIGMEQYAEIIYGWCLGRILHFIVALRLTHPGQRIFIAKYDYIRTHPATQSPLQPQADCRRHAQGNPIRPWMVYGHMEGLLVASY
jgi:hypothetical protein